MEKCKSMKKCNCYCSLKQLFKFVKIKNKSYNRMQQVTCKKNIKD